MLDHYLNIVSAQMQKEAAIAEFTDRLSLLPPSELAQIRQTGEIKLAFCDEEWLQKFQGTPLAQKAIALAEQQLRMDAEDATRRAERSRENEDFDAQRENVRLEKRLLELELAKSAIGGGLPPSNAPAPPPAAPEAPAVKAAAAEEEPTQHSVLPYLAGGAALGAAGLGAYGGYRAGRNFPKAWEQAKQQMDPEALADFQRLVDPETLKSFAVGAGRVGGAVRGAVLGGLGGVGAHYAVNKDKPVAPERGPEEGGRAISPYVVGGAALGMGALGAYAGKKWNRDFPKTLERVKNIRLDNGRASLGEAFNPYVPKDVDYIDADAVRQWGHKGMQAAGGALGLGAGGLAGYGAGKVINNQLDQKTAAINLRGAGNAVLDFAKKNPLAVGGAVAGALHGGLQEGGGLGSAVLGGAGGGAIGYGIHHWARGTRGLPPLQRPGRGGGGGGDGPPSFPPGTPPGGFLNPAPPSPFEGLRQEVGQKVAFGAAIASGLGRALPMAMNWAKANPIKAGLGAVSALGNFHTARQGGDGLGGAALSAAGGLATAAL